MPFALISIKFKAEKARKSGKHLPRIPYGKMKRSKIHKFAMDQMLCRTVDIGWGSFQSKEDK